ncbi:MAG: hypothetical protein IKR17_04570 [Bacteroidales bacterium]|nr:hypothetical protein [Bacteroidales bacterium]
MLKNILHKIARGIVFAMSSLPMCVHYAAADVIRFVMYRIVRYRRKVVRENLLIVFPEKTDEERRDIEKRFYKHFADYIVETLKNFTISREELLKRMVIVNKDEINEQILHKGQSAFVYAAHFGNWEWFTVWPYILDAEIHTFYKKQRNKFVNDLTVYGRERTGVTAVPSAKGYRHMVECKQQGKTTFTLIIGDQSPKPVSSKVWVNFFGRETAFLGGPEVIARKLDLALLYPSVVGYKRGYYRVKLIPISLNPKEVDAKELVRRFAALLEDDIRSYPELWLWSHRRWKLKREDFPDDK